jgi:hypothetical protein
VTLERSAPPATATVRDATFDVLRRLQLTTIFSNPGSTEVPLLAGLPADLTFVLALHEGSVVAMAAGHALGSGAPALALLHSTPGFGNAVAAIATARSNRAPLVIIVGQQDRRHLALDPFLAGKLNGLRLRAASGDRRADGAARSPRPDRRRRRRVALPDPGAVERGGLRRRRAVHRPAQRRLRDHEPARRARRQRRPVARAGLDRHHRDGARSGL